MKYTIIKVTDRSIDNVNNIKKILNQFEHTDEIIFCNGNLEDADKILDNEGVTRRSWAPYDGRTSKPLPGELGIFVSYINIFKYIIENQIDKLLVIEDDAALLDNFVDLLLLYLDDLPEDFDFLSLSYFSDQNDITESTDIGSKYIHRSFNQYSSAVGIVFSLKGAYSILELFKKIGMEATSDNFIFYYSKQKMLNGFSLIKNESPLIKHHGNFISVIDPDNYRGSVNVL
jgi:GR25 family glycosyltransferase involved in LPS biosynthesis